MRTLRVSEDNPQTSLNLRLKSRITLFFGYQKDFASAVGVDPPFVSKVINGRRSLTEREMGEWARVLGCQVEDVF